MFYEAWGLLLERAEQVLREDVGEHVCDPRAQAQLETVRTLLSELAAMWPGLFAALEAETRALAQGAPAGPLAGAEIDPLGAHRTATLALNDAIGRVSELDGPERDAARAQIRQAILAAARIQGAVVTEGAARTADLVGRRM